MTLETRSIDILQDCLATLQTTFDSLPEFKPDLDLDAARQVLLSVAERMTDNYPYAHPMYAGQMLKPPHAVARLAYMLALWVNPNNHALDGGRASSAMEKEAVAKIAQMFGWQDSFLGHLTSGGTMANLEALWVAGIRQPGKTIVASEQSHYTHSRISDVLRLSFESVAVDASGRMDIEVLKKRLDSGNIGTVVATLGTTGVGAVDPLPEILELREQYGFRVHIDAAYGGYFKLARNLETNTQDAYAAITEADSLVIDPHKCGLQPYGCGCILFRDPSVGAIYQHDSPYTYFTSDELHLGEISLECSRAGASAVALWATQQMLPMTEGGEFALGIESSREAALQFYERVSNDPDELSVMPPELDIIVWAPRAASASEISRLSQQAFQDAAENGLHLAIINLPRAMLEPHWHDVEFDTDTVSCLRSCLMKSDHLEWLDRIWDAYKNR